MATEEQVRDAICDIADSLAKILEILEDAYEQTQAAGKGQAVHDPWPDLYRED